MPLDPANPTAPEAPVQDTIIDRLGAVDDLFAEPPAPDPSNPTPPAGPSNDPASPLPADSEKDDMASFLGKEDAPTAPDASSVKPDEADDKVPDGMTEKAGQRWKELKSEIKDWKRKFEEASTSQAPPEAVNKLKAAEAEATALREKLESYERELTGVKLEATEEYQKRVIQPLDTVRATVEDLADTYELDIEALNSAVVEDNRKERVKKLARLAEPMLEPDRLKLYRTAEEFDAIVNTKTSLEENAAETLQRFDRERADTQRRQSVEELRKQKEAADQMWELMSRKLPFLADEATAKAIRAEADTVDFSSADSGLRAYGAYAGAALPRLSKALREKDVRIAELERQIGAFKGAAPTAGGSAPASGPKPGSFLDAIEQGLGGR
jgi:hypothetical protein